MMKTITKGIKMKVINKSEKEFQPITLEIRIETEQERNDLFNLLNHTWIRECLKTDFDDFRDLIYPHETGWDTGFEEFAKKVKDRFDNGLNL